MAQPFLILVASDLSEWSGNAFDQAAHLAQRIPNASLHFLHVPDDKVSADRIVELGGLLRTYVSEKAQVLGGLKGIRVGVHVRPGEPAREIAQLAAELEAAVIVIDASSGPSLKALFSESTAHKLLTHAPCPVVFAGPKPVEPAQRGDFIVPPCPDCAKARAASNGKQWWCDRHSPGGYTGAHVYSYERELPFADHDSEVVPTGVRF
jgi:nucleotide-binding universal stress UspA family protein